MSGYEAAICSTLVRTERELQRTVVVLVVFCELWLQVLELAHHRGVPLLEVVSMYLSHMIKHPDTLGQAVRPCGADNCRTTNGSPTVSATVQKHSTTGDTGLGDSKDLAEVVQQLVCGDVTLDLYKRDAARTPAEFLDGIMNERPQPTHT